MNYNAGEPWSLEEISRSIRCHVLNCKGQRMYECDIDDGERIVDAAFAHDPNEGKDG